MAFLSGKKPAGQPSPYSAAPSKDFSCPHCGKDTRTKPDKGYGSGGGAAEAKVVIQHMIDELEKTSGLTSWEQDFVSSVTDQFNKRGTLSEKQVATLTKIYDEKC